MYFLESKYTVDTVFEGNLKKILNIRICFMYRFACKYEVRFMIQGMKRTKQFVEWYLV